MKAALKKKWVAALRSGKYKQCVGRLYDSDSKEHCCLGVLRHCVTGRNQGHEAGQLLSFDFAKEIGLDPDSETTLAMDLNDNGVPFDRIAAWIEKNVR